MSDKKKVEPAGTPMIKVIDIAKEQLANLAKATKKK